MSIYVCVQISERIVCDCSFARFPHPLSQCNSHYIDSSKSLPRKISPRTLNKIRLLLESYS